MDVEGRPEEHVVVMADGKREDFHFRKVVQQGIADGGAHVGLVERDDQAVRLRFFNVQANVGFDFHLAHDLDIGTFRDRGEDEVTHKAGAIGDKNADCFIFFQGAYRSSKSH
jgi:hypothetical protein